MTTLPQDTIPGLVFPTTTLRLGFAGNRDLNDPSGAIGRAITQVLDAVERSIPLTRGLGVSTRAADGRLPTFSDLSPARSATSSPQTFATAIPTLRLITGLAEGADRLACDLFLSRTDPTLLREMGAILPFDSATYRLSREPSHHDSFDRLKQACAYVLELDGHYAPGPEHQMMRARAYRAQSRILLRQIDLLIAVANPLLPERPGGTLETVRSALQFGVPVLLIHATTGHIRWLDPSEDPAIVWLESESLDPADAPRSSSHRATEKRPTVDDTLVSTWETRLRRYLDEWSPAPRESNHGRSHQESHRARPHQVIEEYFSRRDVPPRTLGGRVQHGWRARVWLAFANLFSAPRPSSDHTNASSTIAPSPSDATVPAGVANYRQRARDLSEYYSTLYRGAFLTNYLLAVCAVTLAAACLVLLGEQHTGTAKKLAKTLELSTQMVLPGSPDEQSVPEDQGTAHAAANQHESSPWLERTILILTAIKLLIVLAIFANTHQANHAGWSERGVDYRYLAERLRAIHFLPLVGSFQPPAPTPPQFATRAMRQSDVDWLFRAMVRTLSPLTFTSTKNTPGPLTVAIDPLTALNTIESKWIRVQADYHATNATHLSRIAELTESLGRTLNWVVIVVVSIDITILVSNFLPWSALHFLHALHSYAPWLVFLAAVLPAVVASLNGIRFQSECKRLSDRSRVVSRILNNHAQEASQLRNRIERARAKPETDPGAWILPTLDLAERCAHDLIEEVGEWSVLYAKEIAEP